MKSNYLIANQAQQEKFAAQIAKEELLRQKRILCPECQANTVYQTLATVFTILRRRYHHTPAWLNRLKDEIEDEFALMETGFLGRDYTANQLVKSLMEIGVDFTKTQYTAESAK